MPTKLSYFGQSIFAKDETTINVWIFEWRVETWIHVLIHLIVGVPTRIRIRHQRIDNDVFWIPTISRAQCILGTESYPDASMNCDYQIEKSFKPIRRLYCFLIVCLKVVSVNRILNIFFQVTKIQFICFW